MHYMPLHHKHTKELRGIDGDSNGSFKGYRLKQ